MTDLVPDKVPDAVPNEIANAVPEKNLGGRPMVVLTEKQKEKLSYMAPYLTADQIADCLEVPRRTFFEILKRDEEVAALYKKHKSDKVAEVASNLVNKAIGGDTTAAIFFLKTQAGWSENKLNAAEKPQIQINVNSLIKEKEVQPIIDVQAIDVDEE
jgi:hypothetical protein